MKRDQSTPWLGLFVTACSPVARTVRHNFIHTFTIPLTISLPVVAVIGLFADFAAAQSVSFKGLPGPSGGSTVTGISADGTVVIGNTGSGGNCGEAASWTNGTRTLLGFPGNGTCSFANGASSNGKVIAGIGNNAGNNAPVVWTNGTATMLPQNHNCCGSPPPPCGAGALGVNADATGPNSSVVVGADGSGQPGCGPGIPVEWVNGTEIAIFGWSPSGSGEARAVNADGAVVVGRIGVSCQAGSCPEAFRWTSGGNTILGDFGGNSSEAYAVSADGSTVVGTANVDNTNSKAFRWTQSTGLVGLGPAAVFSEALAVNGDGSVVVGQVKNAGPAFRWTATTGFQNLQTLLTANGVGSNLKGWGLVQATGISEDGTSIVGWGNGPTSGQGFIATLPIGATNQTDTHDYNDAGRSDLLLHNKSGELSVWLMNGSQVLQKGNIGVESGGWSVIGQRDFNGDGDADILLAHTNGSLQIWFMDGLKVSSKANLSNKVPADSTLQGTGDLNGDGIGDLLWRDAKTGALSAWFMNGSKVTGKANLGSMATSWNIVGSDAHGDILFENSAGRLEMWQVVGSKVQAKASIGTMAKPWQFAGVGDFNGDGYIDLVFRNSKTGQVQIWLMTGTQPQSMTNVGSMTTSWTIAQTGDFNGDGMSDILWINKDGSAEIWFMNGQQFTTGSFTIGSGLAVQSLNAD